MAVFTHTIQRPLARVTASPAFILYALGPLAEDGSLQSHVAGGVYNTLNVSLQADAVRARVCERCVVRARPPPNRCSPPTGGAPAPPPPPPPPHTPPPPPTHCRLRAR